MLTNELPSVKARLDINFNPSLEIPLSEMLIIEITLLTFKRSPRESHDLNPNLFLCKRSWLARVKEVRVLWFSKHLNNFVAPSYVISLLPRSRWINEQFYLMPFNKAIKPEFPRLFLPKSKWLNWSPVIIKEITFAEFSPSPHSRNAIFLSTIVF